MLSLIPPSTETYLRTAVVSPVAVPVAVTEFVTVPELVEGRVTATSLTVPTS